MTDAERKQRKFQRPKRWFNKQEYKLVRKQWIFGLTTSNGKALNFLVSKPRTAEQWAGDVKRKVIPFLKKAFPERSSFRILLDGERLLNAPVAKTALASGGITTLPNWPAHSPQLNPQEHVWSTGFSTNADKINSWFAIVHFPYPFHVQTLSVGTLCIGCLNLSMQ